MTDIDKMADNYMSNVKKNSVEKNKTTMNTICCIFDGAKQFSDGKVHLAMQTYDLVCRC